MINAEIAEKCHLWMETTEYPRKIPLDLEKGLGWIHVNWFCAWPHRYT
jgi:hypothetical protein